MFSGKIIGIIDFSGLPQVVEHDGQFPCDTNHGSLFSNLATAFSQLQAPMAQIAIGSKRPETVLCGTDQQAAQVGVTRFRDTCTCSAGASVRS